MTLASNPYVKTELDNLVLQFGMKALLTLDDYCALFNTGRKMATRHMKRRGVPRVKVGHEVFIPMQELALFLARKKAQQNNEIIVKTETLESRKSQGFKKKAHLAQLMGAT